MRKTRFLSKLCDEYAAEIIKFREFIKMSPDAFEIQIISLPGGLKIRYFDGKTIETVSLYKCKNCEVIESTFNSIILKLTYSDNDVYYIGINRQTHEEFSLPKKLFEQKENLTNE